MIKDWQCHRLFVHCPHYLFCQWHVLDGTDMHNNIIPCHVGHEYINWLLNIQIVQMHCLYTLYNITTKPSRGPLTDFLRCGVKWPVIYDKTRQASFTSPRGIYRKLLCMIANYYYAYGRLLERDKEDGSLFVCQVHHGLDINQVGIILWNNITMTNRIMIDLSGINWTETKSVLIMVN